MKRDYVIHQPIGYCPYCRRRQLLERINTPTTHAVVGAVLLIAACLVLGQLYGQKP